MQIPRLFTFMGPNRVFGPLVEARTSERPLSRVAASLVSSRVAPQRAQKDGQNVASEHSCKCASSEYPPLVRRDTKRPACIDFPSLPSWPLGEKHRAAFSKWLPWLGVAAIVTAGTWNEELRRTSHLIVVFPILTSGFAQVFHYACHLETLWNQRTTSLNPPIVNSHATISARVHEPRRTLFNDHTYRTLSYLGASPISHSFHFHLYAASLGPLTFRSLRRLFLPNAHVTPTLYTCAVYLLD